MRWASSALATWNAGGGKSGAEGYSRGSAAGLSVGCELGGDACVAGADAGGVAGGDAGSGAGADAGGGGAAGGGGGAGGEGGGGGGGAWGRGAGGGGRAARGGGGGRGRRGAVRGRVPPAAACPCRREEDPGRRPSSASWHHEVPRFLRIVSAMREAAASITPVSVPSTITRARRSVPEYRTRTRPSPDRADAISRITGPISGCVSRGGFEATGTFRRI